MHYIYPLSHTLSLSLYRELQSFEPQMNIIVLTKLLVESDGVIIAVVVVAGLLLWYMTYGKWRPPPPTNIACFLSLRTKKMNELLIKLV